MASGGARGLGFLGGGGGISPTFGDEPAEGGDPGDEPSPVGRWRLGEAVGVTSDAEAAEASGVPEAPLDAPAVFCLRFALRPCFGRALGGTATARIERRGLLETATCGYSRVSRERHQKTPSEHRRGSIETRAQHHHAV